MTVANTYNIVFVLNNNNIYFFAFKKSSQLFTKETKQNFLMSVEPSPI